MNNKLSNTTGFEIAVVGMSGRFPGAENIDEFWENLKNGIESISFFSKDEDESKYDNPELTEHPNYINAKGIIENIEYFDADFFDCLPREAEIMDPQLRFLYECAWEALEVAGYNPMNYKGRIGSYIGVTQDLNWLVKVLKYKSGLGMNEISLNSSEFFSTRLSYKLNLRGPSLTVQTACSTSLVAIHLACQGLISGECSMALAGGVKLAYPQKSGYIYQEGSINSKDGHCRAFDIHASGTVGGNGAGIVLLKRLEDAIKDGDYIYSVIKGSAINNDGIEKVGYTAPSPKGQAEVIRAALQMAEVEAESISYVETHGTGTRLGDPIEIDGLKTAFNSRTKGYCRLGSVKTNIGHLDNAAGVAGFIKSTLALKNRQIPPSLNFTAPNPNIDFANSPFIVNTELMEWKNEKYPLRAGVSSFGIGGTNAHVVLEEAPQIKYEERGRKYKLITLSARTNSALEKMTVNLVQYLERNQQVNLNDVAYTLHVGRKTFKNKRMLVCSSVDEAIEELASIESSKVKTMTMENIKKDIVFMFPGQGSQYVNMGYELYLIEPIFKKEIDRCFDILTKLENYDIKSILYNDDSMGEKSKIINRTEYTQPIIFIFEYSLAKLLNNWGIKQDIMIGHSIGEYVAACLSGVLALEDALYLVYNRGKLMQSLPQGSMLSIPESEEKLKELIGDKVSIAAVNGQAYCVISGTNQEIDTIDKYLSELGYNTKRLHTSHAFHSAMVEPILEEFRTKLKDIKFDKIKIPYISNLTGKLITYEEASNPDYWVKHLRNTVRFHDGVSEIAKKSDYIYLEVGPGNTLSSIVKQYLKGDLKKAVLNTVRHTKEAKADSYYLLNSLGYLSLLGVDIDWKSFYSTEKRHRLPLPTYPFERKRFFIDNNVQISFTNNKLSNRNEESLKVYERPENDIRYTPPRSEKEQKIIDAFEQVLGINKISINEDFFEIGGDSIMAMEVVSKLKKDFYIHVNNIFEWPNAIELAKNITFNKDNLDMLISRLKNTNTQSTFSTSDEVEFEKELRIYRKNIEQYSIINKEDIIKYNNILLTGSTGYLGTYLLREILEHTDSKVHLIIRGNSEEEARTRIIDKMNYYFDKNLYEKYITRIAVYIGDLTKEHLSICDNTYKFLCEKIDCIINSAANVSHFGKYEDSYEANVLTTKRLIEFARTGKTKDFNHISTLGVAEGNIENVTLKAFTEDDCDVNQHMTAVYPKSKLEAEKLLYSERERGLCVNIFRIGNILFDSTTGKFQSNKEQNAIYSIIKSFVKLGLIPEGFGSNTIISCVDYISEAILLLFNKAALRNETYHLENCNTTNLSYHLTSDYLALGVRSLSLEEFLDYLHRNYDSKELLPYISILYTHVLNGDDIDNNLSSRTNVRIFTEKTIYILDKLGFKWNEIGEKQIKDMIEHCKEVNYF